MWMLLAACEGHLPSAKLTLTTSDAGTGSAYAPTETTSEGSTPTETSLGSIPPALLPAEQWVIYLVMPDRFRNGDLSNDNLGVPSCYDPLDPSLHHGGDWRGLEGELDYLADLGVNAVWITPPYQQVPPTSTSCGYHGYWGDFVDPDDGALEPKLGAEADLLSLSSALHARGMALVLDLVPNHSGRGSRLLSQRPDWFHDADDCEGSDEPDVDCSLNGLPDFDQENPEVDAYLRAQSASWVTRFEVDAVRIDTTKHLPPAWLGDSYLPAITSDRDRFVVGEIFDESGYDRIEDYLSVGLPSAFDFPLRRALVDSIAHGGSIDLAAERVEELVERFGIDAANRSVHLLDNHDVQRFTEDVLHRPDEEATGRYRLALAALMTLPGIPQIMWGDELGMLGGPDPDNRRDMPGWAFEPELRTGDYEGYLPDVGGTFEAARSLIALRGAHAALTVGSYAEMWRHNNNGPMVWAFFRSSGEDRLIVAIHAGTTASGPLSMSVQGNPDISEADKAAMPDGASLALLWPPSGVGGARIEGGRLLVDDIPPLTAAIWSVGP